MLRSVFTNPKTVYPDFSLNINDIVRNFNLLRFSVLIIDLIFFILLGIHLESVWLLLIPAVIVFWYILVAAFIKAFIQPVLEITKKYFNEHSSEIIIYFSGRPYSEHTLMQWADVLGALKKNKTIIIRELHLIKSISRFNIPCVRINDDPTRLFSFFKGTEKVAFYVTNAMKNLQMLSLQNCSHILLNHGESDKSESARYIARIYDYLFVAGQAAIDRYEKAGIYIPSKNFRVVGRPQLEIFLKRKTKERVIDNRLRTILYAPTFHGFLKGESYSLSSLQGMGLEIAQKILDSGRYRLIVKLHPMSYTNISKDFEISLKIRALLNSHADSRGVWIDPVNPEIELYDCFLEADLLISDVSSVPIDYMPLNRPIIATNPFGIEVSEGENKFPFWKGSYILKDANDVVPIIDEALEEDPKKEEREKAARYYLGDDVFKSNSLMDQFIMTVDSIMEDMQRAK